MAAGARELSSNEKLIMITVKIVLFPDDQFGETWKHAGSLTYSKLNTPFDIKPNRKKLPIEVLKRNLKNVASVEARKDSIPLESEIVQCYECFFAKQFSAEEVLGMGEDCTMRRKGWTRLAEAGLLPISSKIDSFAPFLICITPPQSREQLLEGYRVDAKFRWPTADGFFYNALRAAAKDDKRVAELLHTYRAPESNKSKDKLSGKMLFHQLTAIRQGAAAVEGPKRRSVTKDRKGFEINVINEIDSIEPKDTIIFDREVI